MLTCSGLNNNKEGSVVDKGEPEKGIDTATASKPIPSVLRPPRKPGAGDLLSYFQNAVPEYLLRPILMIQSS
jgi:hypothetical protein